MKDKLAFLVGTLPNGKPGKWSLNQPSIVIGREQPADIVLPFPTISRQHACITQTLSGHFIADLDSRNGTFIGKKLVGKEPQLLSDGDEIVLGGAITFRFIAPVPADGDARARGISIDETAHAVWVDGTLVVPPLSHAQMALLVALNRSPGEIISREQIVAAAWHSIDPRSVSSTAVDGLIKRLRNRLHQAQPDNKYIQVLRGKGIRLERSEEHVR